MRATARNGENEAAQTLQRASVPSTGLDRPAPAIAPPSIVKADRVALLGQRPKVIWFTGLSGAGKSTIARELERLLHHQGRHTMLLDGDDVRLGLSRDLGFSDADRAENIRRIAEVARLMTQAGLIVIVSFISPFRADRQMARDLMDEDEFIEVFVDTPLEECMRRDPKGLYQKAMAGLARNVTGLDSAYERPENPELHLKTLGRVPSELAAEIVRRLLVDPEDQFQSRF
jgi:bifunctional enzyme CysN/CysC